MYGENEYATITMLTLQKVPNEWIMFKYPVSAVCVQHLQGIVHLEAPVPLTSILD